ncbi:PREDICTED: uncharacterized protein LOC107064790 isoform X2 [Polistes dominula]|uniref:Uncharacterized protein LOC107064790 isoform X2 n=1 Tax=Polistes dominula TaxID=743375 RepID=A0ABM1HZC9_POLDO|nr:PREDICTED: uncharacterized protein LOC107064790 isoform X2 [Polistes dominula]
MIKMSFSLIISAWLIIFGTLTKFTNGEFEFYQDAVPEAPQDITALKQFAEYITNQNRKQQMHHSYLLPLLTSQINMKHHLDLTDQEKNELFKSLKGKYHFNDRLRDERLTPWNYISQIQPNDLKQTLPKNDYNLLYFGTNPMLKNVKYYFNPKVPYRNKFIKENPKYRDIDVAYVQDKMSPKETLYNPEIDDNVNKEALVKKFFHQNNLMSTNRQTIEENKSFIQQIEQIQPVEQMQPIEQLPKFTYYLGEPDIKDKHPFAIKPNDPRYYKEIIWNVDTKSSKEYEEMTVEPITNKENLLVETTTVKQLTDTDVKKHDEVEDINVSTLMETEQSEENRPFIFAMPQDLNDDIYFIAIIAGCSAAAMFICVLISLTWCRLQRGVKAAADIEYPAYGVTGPNKDISPSEDQRLAQSAQMYHFQHQKQQIIAMEKDTGSVSDAESDEENEEGDYTVYECPGLAATSEMEVKNPLFNDVPTPATPAHTNKEEDHM